MKYHSDPHTGSVVLSSARYDVRQLGRKWLVFDTFWQEPCQYLEFEDEAEARSVAEAHNRAYETRL